MLSQPEEDLANMCAVVKVYTFHAAASYSSPWKTSSQWSSVGSALPISGRRLLTNAHVAANAHLIHVRRSDGHKKFVARVHAMCPQCDLAVLHVEEELFWERLTPIELAGGLPKLQDEVAVVGFPDAPSGGESVCITQGVVSRIDLHSYAWNSRLLAIQIDAAINPGNSGGPCVDTRGMLVGVAFQKGVDKSHDNIGYIIPTYVVARFLECCANKGWGFGVVGMRYSLLDNPSLCESVGLPSEDTGVLVTAVEALGPLKGLLEPGADIIVSIDGERVGEDGTVALTEGTSSGSRGHLRVPLEWMFRRRLPKEMISLEVLRHGQRREVRAQLSHGRRLVPSDPLDGERLGTQPEYLLVGGLVFVPLTLPFLMEICAGDLSNSPTRLLHKTLHGRLEFPGQQVVIISEVLACELTQGYEVHHLRQVISCDGEAVRNLGHLASLVARSKETFLRFQLSEDQVIALRREGLAEATEAVAKLNQIAKPENLIPAEREGLPSPPPSKL